MPIYWIFMLFLCSPPIFLQKIEINLRSIGGVASCLNREDVDSLNFLLAIAAILVPLGLAWLYINR